MKRFEGKSVVITGAGSGIGAACVRRLHEEGAAVVAIDVNLAEAQKVVAGLGAGAKALALAADVADRAQVEAAIATAAQELGGLYGLVNCAGVRGVGSLLDFEDEAWRRVMSINLDGTFLTCQAFARELRKADKPGAIVNFSSLAGGSAASRTALATSPRSSRSPASPSRWQWSWVRMASASMRLPRA